MKEKVVVLGAGESGIGSALLAKKHGFDVFVSDLKPLDSSHCERFKKEGIEWEAGKHTIEQMLGATWIVKSPGIPSTVAHPGRNWCDQAPHWDCGSSR